MPNLLHGGAEFLFHFVDLLLLYLLGGIPALGRHFLVDFILHTQGFIQGIVKSLLNPGIRGH